MTHTELLCIALAHHRARMRAAMRRSLTLRGLDIPPRLRG